MKFIYGAFIVIYIALLLVFVFEVMEFVKTKNEYDRIKAEEWEAQRKYDATVQELIETLTRSKGAP